MAEDNEEAVMEALNTVFGMIQGHNIDVNVILKRLHDNKEITPPMMETLQEAYCDE